MNADIDYKKFSNFLDNYDKASFDKSDYFKKQLKLELITSNIDKYYGILIDNV